MHKAPLDTWSIAHFFAGALFLLFTTFDLLTITFIAIGWEIFEYHLKQWPPLAKIPLLNSLRPAESVINAVTDILLVILGWVLAHFYIYGTFY